MARAKKTNPSKQPLKCSVEGSELVIRIGIGTLSHCAENCSELVDYPRNQHPPYATVTDQAGFAEDVCRELLSEEEDGSSPLTRLFDKAFEDAIGEGSISIVMGEACAECDGLGEMEDGLDCSHCKGSGSEPE